MDEPARYPVDGLVAYDDTWPSQFEAARGGLVAVLGPAWTVEHIGSTAVPGLLAKPVIDLAVRIAPDAALAAYDDALASAGWLQVGSSVSSHGVRMRLEGAVRTHIAHFFPAEAWDTAHQHLFVAWLRAHDEDRRRYAELKQTLWADGTWGRTYTAAKGAFVQEVVDRARADLGLPPVSVADKP
ncbi:GrpB family protein [Nocardioides zhouii]|uniref:GrpB family protein n=1 Tax=Nocardioides zhouii TaxID=1168729 RepID=A0A4Q2T6S2_9ACTN|nr:GrpB family protein [Nocardioides zhouii]RYC13771.1 GrpB family protein [Nocardioides zhouii]